MTDNQIEELLDEETEKLRQSSNISERFGIAATIIELKKRHSRKPSIYSDYKFYLENYILASEGREYGYDEISPEVSYRYLTDFSLAEQIHLLRFFSQKLKIAGYDSEVEWVASKKNALELKYYSCEQFNLFKLISRLTSYNLWSLLGSVLIIVLLLNILFLPSIKPMFHLYDFVYVKYDSNFLVNHFFNVLSYLVDIDNDFKIVCVSWKSVLLLVIIRLFLIVIILNFLVKEVLRRIPF